MARATYTVKVKDKSFDVEVVQKSGFVWIVYGDYMGQQLSTQGGTLEQALTNWQRTAEYTTIG